MFAAQEATMSGKRGRVWRLEDEVFVLVDQFGFFTGVRTPQEKDDVCALVTYFFNYSVGEGLPATTLMTASLLVVDGQGGVE